MKKSQLKKLIKDIIREDSGHGGGAFHGHNTQVSIKLCDGNGSFNACFGPNYQTQIGDIIEVTSGQGAGYGRGFFERIFDLVPGQSGCPLSTYTVNQGSLECNNCCVETPGTGNGYLHWYNGNSNYGIPPSTPQGVCIDNCPRSTFNKFDQPTYTTKTPFDGSDNTGFNPFTTEPQDRVNPEIDRMQDLADIKRRANIKRER